VKNETEIERDRNGNGFLQIVSDRRMRELAICKSSFFYRRFLSIFAGLKIRDIELASCAVLPRSDVVDVRGGSFEVFDKCKRKVAVTANPTVMVDASAKDYLGGDRESETE
jgi:hypothetical protein